jgi:CelD/BcsL family acetyltransferase involved in cellulose biosynthesis
MRVTRITTHEELAALAPDWDRLAGDVPFRTSAWLHSWWSHYGAAARDPRWAKSLYVLVVYDAADRVAGIAPWYVQRMRLAGSVVRMLGSGEVCSDYLSVLVDAECRQPVAAAIAEWLAEHGAAESEDRWDAIELAGAAKDDASLAALARACADRGLWANSQPGPKFWRIELPSTWAEYLAMLSRSHRKQLRRIDRRMFVSGRARVHRVRTQDDLVRAWPIFKHLHQLRRQSRGQRGCFAAPRFEDFLDCAAERLLSSQWLRLDILEIDGRPVAAEMGLAMHDAVYAYQSGLDPARLADEPGRILQMAVIQRAIREGRSAIDLLRGDEPYKSHWRAKPLQSIEIRIASTRSAAALSGSLAGASAGVKQWIKSGLTAAGLQLH